MWIILRCSFLLLDEQYIFFFYFSRPGLYFFMTEGSELGRRHFCAVQVHETQREFKVEILDRSYQPMILLIEEGDRVWWGWDKQKV